MSPEFKDYYSTKQRRKAFYIVENELNNEENPPIVSAVIGLDKELAVAYYAAKRPKRPPMEKPEMNLGIRINRDTNKRATTRREKDDKTQDIIKRKITKKNEIHCPSLPTQWRDNFNIIIPKAEFGY